MNVQSAMEILLCIFSIGITLCIFSIGITYGSLNNRIKQVENTLDDHKSIAERLARIEERLTILLNKNN